MHGTQGFSIDLGLVSCNVQDAKLMEWAAKKKKAVQACPQCYRLIEKGGGCKCAFVMT